MLNFIYSRLLVVLDSMGILLRSAISINSKLDDLKNSQRRIEREIEEVEQSLHQLQEAVAEVKALLAPEPAVALNLTAGPVENQP